MPSKFISKDIVLRALASSYLNYRAGPKELPLIALYDYGSLQISVILSIMTRFGKLRLE